MSSKQNPYVFAVGCPRSGTTLLQRMLNAHPDLAVANDTHFITRAVKHRKIEPSTPLDSDITESVRQYKRFHRLGLDDTAFDQAAAASETYADFVSALYNQLAARERKPLSGEKTPDYCRSLTFLSELFPWAYFVHIIRDGRDVALSTVNWAKDGKGPSSWSTWDESPMGTCAMWWNRQVGGGITQGRVLGDQYQEVIYADLVSDPERVMRRVTHRMDFEYHPQMLEFAKGRTKSDPKLSAKSAWLPPTAGLRDWRTQMREDDTELFEYLSGDLLGELGFERTFDSFSPAIVQMAEGLLEKCDKRGVSVPKVRDRDAVINIPDSFKLERHVATTTRDQQVIANDRKLVGLADVLDGGRLLDRIRPSLKVHVDEMVPVYVRYKPGTNCLVAYEASADGETFWLYAKAHLPGELEKLKKAASVVRPPTRFGPGTILVEDASIVVRIFPFDAKLRTLSRFEGDIKREIVGRLFDQSDWMTGVKFEPIRWKPERRLVARMSVNGKDHAAVKFMSSGSFGQVWGFARYPKTLAQIRTPRVIGHSKRLQAVAYEWLDGQLLADDIRQSDFDPSRLDPVAAMLAELHAGSTVRLPTFVAEHRVDQMRAASSALEVVAPDLSARVDRLFAGISEAISSADQELVFIHGDFYAKQILIDEDGATFLDFDQASLGNRHDDIGNFVAHLFRDGVRSQISESRAREAESRFVDAYRTEHPEVHERILRAYTAAGLLRLAPHPFRFREENWFEQTEAIIGIAESYLKKSTSRTSYAEPKVSHRQNGVRKAERLVVERALDREEMEPRLGDLFSDAGHSRPKLTDVRLIRNRPGRRSLVRYTLSDAARPSETRTVLGKIREKGLDKRTASLTKELFDGAFGVHADDGIQVPEPLGCIPEINMWLQQRVSASPVTDLLSTETSASFGKRVAGALYKLHSKGSAVTRRHGIEDELTILKEGLQSTASRRPDLKERLSALHERARELASSLDSLPETPVHRDFYPDQILLSDLATYLVDLDLYAMGDPALDVGNFIAHLREMALRMTGDFAAFDHEVGSFRDAYLERSGLALGHNIDVYEWLSLARHVWISTRIRERNGFTERILEQCEALEIDRLGVGSHSVMI